MTERHILVFKNRLLHNAENTLKPNTFRSSKLSHVYKDGINCSRYYCGGVISKSTAFTKLYKNYYKYNEHAFFIHVLHKYLLFISSRKCDF